MKYSINERVRTSYMDCDGEFSLIGAAHTVQDAICDFFGSFGLSNIVMKETFGAVWAFSKNKIRFLSQLHWQEAFTVECFFSRISHVSAIVDTAIKRPDGNIAVYSRTVVCPISLSDGKVLRLSDVGFPSDATVVSPVIDMEFERSSLDAGERVSTVTVPYTSIDYCRHTNNVEYLRFILNTYGSDEMRRSPIKDAEIRFLSQTREKDVLEIFAVKSGKKHSFAVKSGEKTVTECLLSF